MSTLIPVHASEHVLGGVSEYLATAFSLANPETSNALKAFLEDTERGMFHGPYVRTRLPYAQAVGWDGILDWMPGWFTPYHHQAEAFRRLRSKDEHGSHRPEPTLVITGTGSGKTESFLYPVLDHAARARAQGQRGTKALLLYPMNALANDQADRLAKLITSEPALAGVTAGIYTGEASGSVKKVTKDSLINDRDQIRQDPPDILLTNYKMLDQLLLREEDRQIWKRSATSLQYLVLDEFHTYDGAQGTDVALLLRRLGLMLKAHQPEGFLGEYEANPLGRVTPVATSATLGGKDDTQKVLDFAETIFGERFTADALVGERTLTYEQWIEEIAQHYGAHTGGLSPDIDQLKEIVETIAEDSSGRDHADVVLDVFRAQLWGVEAGASLDATIAAYAVHPITRTLLQAANPAKPLIRRASESAKPLPEEMFDPIVVRSLGETTAREFVTHLLTAVAHVRALAGEEYGFGGKRLPGVETHLWVREVSRIERAVTPTEDGEVFRFADDGQLGGDDAAVWLPAIYCRECGRAGWMTAMEPGTDAVVLNGAEIRRASVDKPELVRPLVDATAEYREAVAKQMELTQLGEDDERELLWFHTATRMLTRTEPDEEALAEGSAVPVMTYTGLGVEEKAAERTCPSCGETDTIRFIGSRVATLLSVGLSNLFGMPSLAQDEKKTLVFADSVQDAAHRAGYVQSRARAFAIRTLMRSVVAGSDAGGQKVSLAQMPLRILERADASADPARARFELLPPELAETPAFTPFWSKEADAAARREATGVALNRLALDVALEFGQRAHLPWSLVSTGELVPTVEVEDAVLLAAAEEALKHVDAGLFEVADASSPELRLRWLHGLLELVRARGGVYSPALKSYLLDDANTWRLHNRYAKAQGVPSFPRGGSPEFPRSGASLDDRDRGITPLGGPRGRYARWTSKVLGISTHDAATVLTTVFKVLAREGAIDCLSTSSGGTIYALKPEDVVVRHEDQPALLQCRVCQAPLGVDRQNRSLLAGLPCPTPGCVGELVEEEIAASYYSRLYTSTTPRAVVAREHTGLIPKEERLALERAFRGTDDEAPNAPNVLVATPTLEMGIDIGDLSTVMLASLPTSVSSYVQRVGRAGRLTGNSLVLAFVQGRGTTLPKLNQPLSVIAGTVVPPAAFLSATEILRRQTTAYLVDTMEFSKHGLDVKDAQDVFSTRKASLVEALGQEVAAGVGPRVGAFLATVRGSHVDDATVDGVRDWACGQGPDSLVGQLERTRLLWEAEKSDLYARWETLRERMLELDAKVDPNAGTENADPELEREKRSTKAAWKRTGRDLNRILLGEYWINSMERYGLLPNFTLLDDAVELAVVVSQLNPSSMQIDPETFELSRGVSSALTELAPGNTFYARGIAARVDAVELGAGGADVEQWRLCPDCSYGERVQPGASPGSCPVCGAGAFADKGQVLETVRMRRVSAEVDRARATIDGSDEERRRMFFHTALSFSVPEGGYGGKWFLSQGFGAQYLRYVNLSWFNLGRGPATKKLLAAKEVDAPLFTVCNYCGHLDSQAGTNSKWDHRPWCPKRNAREEESVTVALNRTLRTQGVLLHVPVQLTAGDKATIPSLTAAIKLGFKEVLGGDPDHLNVVTVRVPDATGKTVEALLMHDNVPGGTGYLSQFASPDDVRRLLERAFTKVEACACKGDERLACPECLLPYTNYQQLEVTSRAAAERTLRAILSNQDHPAQDLDPLSVQWEPQTEAPQFDSASNLEVRFREVVRDALEARNATVTDIPNAGGVEWHITMAGGEEWSMREQHDYGYTRPDFLFQHRRNPRVRPVAVYTDGAAFHFSAQHYRFPGDIQKRNSLHFGEPQVLPWNVTDAGLDWFAKEVDGTAGDPAWITEDGEALARKNDLISDDAMLFMKASPITQLLTYLAQPDRAYYSAVDEALIALLRDTARPSRHSTGVRLTLRNEIHVDITPFDGRMVPRGLSVDAEVPDSITADNWRDFLRFANIMWLANNTAVVSVGDGSVVGEPEGVDRQSAVEAAVSGLWAEAIEEFEDESEVVAALRTLVDAGAAPTEEIGEEIESIPTAVSWTELRIALLIEQDASYAAAEAKLRESGWTLLYPDTLSPETIPAALLGKE